MRKLSLLILAITITVASYSQEIKTLEVIMNPELISDGEIAYSDAPINWLHFEGKPDKNSKYIAMTHSGVKISLQRKVENGIASAKVELFPFMDPRKSWYKKDRCNDNTLAHEQRHFDITALFARMLAAEIKKGSFTIANFSGEINKVYTRQMQKLKAMQLVYDEETNHGTLPEQQAAWDKRIAEELQKVLAEG